MRSRFNCSSSSSYDDNETAMTDYTEDTGYDEAKPSGMFQAADEMIQRGIQNLFAAGTIGCGLNQFQQKGNGSRGAGTGLDVDEGVRPDWRKDPYHSMSDWTLIVRDGSSQTQPQTYHIHKSVVSYGQRKSGFFVKVFEQDIMEGNSGRRSGAGATEVALPRRAAKYVPQLLDFVYSDQLDLSAESAPSLRYLANTFDVRDLYALVSSFIQSDLSETTISIYIREAEAVKDKELLGLGMSLAATKFDTMPNESLLQLPPHVFQQLTSNPQLNCPSSERLSQRIAAYSRGRSEEMNDEVFYFMTHAQILPRICPSEAMWFLNFSASHFGNVLVDDSMGGYEGTLKRRCIVAAATDWRNILVDSVKGEIRRRVEGGGEDNGPARRGDSPRRRLFVDGDDETDLDKGQGYMSLPMNVRVELLEEALVNAAAADPTPTHEHVRPTLNQNDMESAEHRSDIGMRETRKGTREKRMFV